MFVVKVPYERGGGEKSFGAKYGPDAIEKAFRHFSWRTSEDGVSHPRVEFVETQQSPYRNTGVSLNLDAFFAGGERSLVVLSGDNSVSRMSAEAVARFSRDPYLVLLDAHPDAGDPASHDPHASWVRKLWESGTVRPEKTFFFGTRDPEEDEMRYVKESGATITSADTLSRMSPQVIVSNLMLHRKINPRGGLNAKQSLASPEQSLHDCFSGLIFVVDIDVIDPSQAPGTGVLRSPGLELRTVLQLISIFGDMPFSLKVGEVSEVIPQEGNQLRPPWDKRPDTAGLTVLAGEAILRQMIRSFT